MEARRQHGAEQGELGDVLALADAVQSQVGIWRWAGWRRGLLRRSVCHGGGGRMSCAAAVALDCFIPSLTVGVLYFSCKETSRQCPVTAVGTPDRAAQS